MQEKISLKLAEQLMTRTEQFKHQTASGFKGGVSSSKNSLTGGYGSRDTQSDALLTFIAKSFDVFIETQPVSQASCLCLIKEAYETLIAV